MIIGLKKHDSETTCTCWKVLLHVTATTVWFQCSITCNSFWEHYGCWESGNLYAEDFTDDSSEKLRSFSAFDLKCTTKDSTEMKIISGIPSSFNSSIFLHFLSSYWTIGLCVKWFRIIYQSLQNAWKLLFYLFVKKNSDAWIERM